MLQPLETEDVNSWTENEFADADDPRFLGQLGRLAKELGDYSASFIFQFTLRVFQLPPKKCKLLLCAYEGCLRAQQKHENEGLDHRFGHLPPRVETLGYYLPSLRD